MTMTMIVVTMTMVATVKTTAIGIVAAVIDYNLGAGGSVNG